MKLPPAIQKALDHKIEFFTDIHCEWKLEITLQNEYIKEVVGSEIVVIANNGYGDYLFLKTDSHELAPKLPLYKFWHEGPEIEQVEEELDVYLGLCPYPPSNTPIPKYSNGQTVTLNDDVEFKSFFRKKKGRVTYITGISPLNHKIETVGIACIEVELECGTRYALTASEEGYRLKKSVRKLALKSKTEYSTTDHD